MKRIKLFFRLVGTPCLAVRDGMWYKLYKDRFGIRSAWDISGELIKINKGIKN